MTSVKIKEEILKELKEKFENLFGKKISDEELIEKCMVFSNSHIDEIVTEKEEILLELTDEKRRRILARARDYEDYYENLSDDQVLYGINED